MNPISKIPKEINILWNNSLVRIPNKDLYKDFKLEKKFDLIDCQFVNEHLLSLGAKVIDSDKFLKILNSAVAKNELDKKWNVNF